MTLCFSLSLLIHKSVSNTTNAQADDNTGSANDDEVVEGQRGKSCEDDEEGHLTYHIGLVMKERCTHHISPPFPLCFSSKRATDTRIATLEIVFCYRDHLTTFTATEELAYYLIQFLFCTINVLSGT